MSLRKCVVPYSKHIVLLRKPAIFLNIPVVHYRGRVMSYSKAVVTLNESVMDPSKLAVGLDTPAISPDVPVMYHRELAVWLSKLTECSRTPFAFLDKPIFLDGKHAGLL